MKVDYKKYIILGGVKCPRERLAEIAEERDCLYIGEHNGASFPINSIKDYDKVFSPYHYSLTTSTIHELGNPYIPTDKPYYYVSIVIKNDKYGLIDSSGAILLSPVFNLIELANFYQDPYFIVKKENCAFIFDVLKFRVISKFYENITVVSQHLNLMQTTNAYFKAYKNGKCGLIHETGTEILPTIFDDCFGLCYHRPNSENPKLKYSIVTLNNKKGLYNELGEEVLPIKYESLSFSYPDSIYAKNLRVFGKELDAEEKILIDDGIKRVFIDKDGKGSDGKFYPKATQDDDDFQSSYERPTYDKYGGFMGYTDDDIDTIFDGDPSAYWNID